MPPRPSLLERTGSTRPHLRGATFATFAMFATFATFATFVTLARIAPVAAAAERDDPKWCRACHDQAVFGAREMSATVHAELTCRDCHQGYHFNPHEANARVDDEAAGALAARHARDPVALASCLECHDDVTDQVGVMAHGRARLSGHRADAVEGAVRPAGEISQTTDETHQAQAEEANEAEEDNQVEADGGDGDDEARAADPSLPYCLECHGNPHSIRAFGANQSVGRRRWWNARCSGCHGDATRMEAADLPHDVSETYAHTTHGRKLHLGSSMAPGCVDCHGGHLQTNLEKDGAKVCGECHSGSNDAFVALAAHVPLTADANPVGYWTLKFFAVLTFVTILLLALHVLLDLIATLRTAAASRTSGPTGQTKED